MFKALHVCVHIFTWFVPIEYIYILKDKIHHNSLNEPAHEIMALITKTTREGLGEPAQSRQSFHCSRTCTMEVDEGSEQKVKTSSPTGWLCMSIWRMNLRRTESTIISWVGSNNLLKLALSINTWHQRNELRHDKSNEMAYAPSEDSD